MKSNGGFANNCINTIVQKNGTFCHGLNQEQSSCPQLKSNLIFAVSTIPYRTDKLPSNPAEVYKLTSLIKAQKI